MDDYCCINSNAPFNFILMCGRFASYKNLNKLKNIFNITNSDFNITQSYNISPGQNVNIILNYKLENYLLESNWGYTFINSNTQNKQIVINSRIETINSKLLFKDSFLKRKCIIPANGYFEWSQKEGEKKPYLITLGNGELIYFAGVWRKEKYNDDKRRVFSIITKTANKKINEIHHRMPVILNANNAQDYLETKDNNLIFDNFEDVDLNFSEVSKYVNNPKNNDEKCLTVIN
ncbi:SOS response-associated peptidase [Pelagibacteraceae bacterium]|nr:SOS response-associated peptidase [Pelagibacteraceae bacterium]